MGWTLLTVAAAAGGGLLLMRLRVPGGMLVGAILVPVALTAVQFVLHLFFGLTDAQHARCVRELASQDTDRS